MTVDAVVNVVTIAEPTTQVAVVETDEQAVAISTSVALDSIEVGIAGPQGPQGPAGSGIFSRGATLANPSGLDIGNYIVWRAPFDCVVTGIYAYRTGGTDATVNAGKGTTTTPTAPILAADLDLPSSDVWTGTTVVQNTAFTVGDALVIEVVSVTGFVTEVGIQVEFLKGA